MTALRDKGWKREELSEQQLAIILELQADFRRYQMNEASSGQHGEQIEAGG